MKISKNVLMAGMGFVLAAGVTFSAINGFYKRKMGKIEESYTAQIAEVNTQAEIAQAHADSVDFVVAQYKLNMDSIEKVKDWYKWDRDRLENELIDAWNTTFDADIDENYEMLQNRYPTSDTLEYPFSGEQVKGIALDIIRLDFKDSVIQNQDHVIELIRAQLKKSGEMVIKLDGERQDLEVINTELRKQLAAKIEDLQLSEEEIAKLRRRVRRIGAGGTGATIGLLALLILL